MHAFSNAVRPSKRLRFGLFCGALCAELAVACSSGSGGNAGAGGATGAGGGAGAGTSAAPGAGGNGATGSGATGNGASGSGASSGASSGGAPSTGGAGVGGKGGGAGVAGAAPAGGGTSSNGGSSGAGGTQPDPPHGDAGADVTLTDLPRYLAEASCGALEQCLGAASSNFFDGGSCKASLGPATVEGSASLFASSVSKGTLAYDSTKVDACLASIRGSGCDYPNRRLDALCPGLVTGKVALGGACSVNAECGATAYCKVTTCPGTCAALVAKGAACSADDDCQDGLVCDTTSKKCLVPGKKGDACTAAAPCGAAFVCDGTAHCVEFQSIFAGKDGQACNPDGQVLCDASLTCALVDIDTAKKGVWKCEKPASPAACHISLPEQCASGSYCELSGTLTGTCKPAPTASAACASRLPSDATVAKDICAPGLTCSAAGVCRARAHLTESCATDGDCFSGTCKNKSCVATSCPP